MAVLQNKGVTGMRFEPEGELEKGVSAAGLTCTFLTYSMYIQFVHGELRHDYYNSNAAGKTPGEEIGTAAEAATDFAAGARE